MYLATIFTTILCLVHLSSIVLYTAGGGGLYDGRLYDGGLYDGGLYDGGLYEHYLYLKDSSLCVLSFDNKMLLRYNHGKVTCTA